MRIQRLNKKQKKNTTILVCGLLITLLKNHSCAAFQFYESARTYTRPTSVTCSFRSNKHVAMELNDLKTSRFQLFSMATSSATASNISNKNNNKDPYGQRIPIDESFKGIEKIYSDPDIFIIKDFLDESSCRDLIHRANEKKLDLSPVAYAGKTDDKKELIALAAKGPAVWFSLLTSWFYTGQGGQESDLVQFGIHVFQSYAVFLLLAFAGITAFINTREDELQSLRTSTSTTLDNLDDPNSGTATFVNQAANLFNPNTNNKENPAKHAQYFEAPTVIRYEKDQVLAPHFDANKAASTEDANRGGQTLATLLVYLNDVDNGGATRFGKLRIANHNKNNNKNAHNDQGEEKYLTIQPKMGDALLFFPADENGGFDDRLEHEGCMAIDTKWIARIWRHIDRVPAPFGLSTQELLKL